MGVCDEKKKTRGARTSRARRERAATGTGPSMPKRSQKARRGSRAAPHACSGGGFSRVVQSDLDETDLEAAQASVLLLPLRNNATVRVCARQWHNATWKLLLLPLLSFGLGVGATLTFRTWSRGQIPPPLSPPPHAPPPQQVASPHPSPPRPLPSRQCCTRCVLRPQLPPQPSLRRLRRRDPRLLHHHPLRRHHRPRRARRLRHRHHHRCCHRSSR